LPLVVTNGEKLTALMNEKRTAGKKFEATLDDINKKHPEEEYVLLVEEAEIIEDQSGETRLRFIKLVMEQIDTSKNPTNL
jgi:type II secretory pathway predicted ATPase ExeA